jgi:DNA processing protein
LAAGIDSHAHQGAVSEDASTVAVMGTGPDIIYPRSNAKLASQIKSQGALISEFELGKPPIANNFPRRNRIISGMSLGVIVIEAALKSGSLITARLAMEQNREVFAIPGSLNNPLAKGCHRLIKEGAVLVDSVESILDELTGLLSFQLDEKKAITTCSREVNSQLKGSRLSDNEKSVLDAIGHDECLFDTLVQNTKLDIQSISSILLDLELKGFVDQRAGRIKQTTTGLQEVSD